MSKVIGIQRTNPRNGAPEEPYRTDKGYCLGDPKHGSKKHHAKYAVYVETLDAAADLIEQGYSLRMKGEGLRPSLVSPKSLSVVRA